MGWITERLQSIIGTSWIDVVPESDTPERIDSVSGDGAYATKRCHAVIGERDAEAIIPVRKNSNLWNENTCPK